MLAIVIPYYKIEFFEETLQSISNQTDKRFKVYIGNDNSVNNPESLLLKYDFEYTYEKFEENLGGKSLVKQWERCLEMIVDEIWLMILGDDDVLGENVVEEFYNNINVINKNNINVIRYSTFKINEKSDITSVLHKHPIIEKSTDFIFRNKRSSLSEYIFKKEKVDIIKFKDFPLAWYSDVLAVLEFSNFSNVYTINHSFVYVRISNLSISGIQDNKKSKSNARFKYYYYLLNYKQSFFDSKQKKILLNMLEKTYLNNKKEIFFFSKALYIHIKIFKIRYLMSFFYKILNSLFK